MIRKITAWLLIALLSVSVFTLGTAAENVSTAQADNDTYNSYNAANSDGVSGKDEIAEIFSAAEDFASKFNK